MPRYPKYDGKTPLTRGVMNDITRQLQGADRVVPVMHDGSQQMDLGSAGKVQVPGGTTSGGGPSLAFSAALYAGGGLTLSNVYVIGSGPGTAYLWTGGAAPAASYDTDNYLTTDPATGLRYFGRPFGGAVGWYRVACSFGLFSNAIVAGALVQAGVVQFQGTLSGLPAVGGYFAGKTVFLPAGTSYGQFYLSATFDGRNDFMPTVQVGNGENVVPTLLSFSIQRIQ